MTPGMTGVVKKSVLVAAFVSFAIQGCEIEESSGSYVDGSVKSMNVLGLGENYIVFDIHLTSWLQ